MAVYRVNVVGGQIHRESLCGIRINIFVKINLVRTESMVQHQSVVAELTDKQQ